DFTTDSEQDPDADQDDEGWENVDEEAGDEEMDQDMLSESEQEMAEWPNSNMYNSVTFSAPFNSTLAAEDSDPPAQSSRASSEADAEMRHIKCSKVVVPAEQDIVVN